VAWSFQLAATGPAWLPSGDTPGIGDRAASRIGQADYTGQAATAEQYLLESIVSPGAHVVEGYAAGIMPANYGARITPQEAADMIAYLLSLR